MNKEIKKETVKDLLIFLAKKKTWMLLLFIIVFILSIRADFSCGRKNGKWDFHISVKNLDDKINKR